MHGSSYRHEAEDERFVVSFPARQREALKLPASSAMTVPLLQRMVSKSSGNFFKYKSLDLPLVPRNWIMSTINRDSSFNTADKKHSELPRDVSGSGDDPSIRAVATKAIELVPDGARIGLGSGRASLLFIAMLGERVREGLRVLGVPTSQASGDEARRAGITLIDLGEGGLLDLVVDGADEVAPNLDLVKGWGGALVRERIVAAASNSQVILVGEDKLVSVLGERGRLPVEVIPLAEWLAIREFRVLGLSPATRMDATGSHPFITDNGNIIVDCALENPLADAKAALELQSALRSIAGVVDTGLFLGTADRVLVGHPDGRVDVLSRPRE